MSQPATSSTFENGQTIYFAGDTSIFGDMRLIGEMYRPQIAFLPIGDLYTMGPEQAAKACELLGVEAGRARCTTARSPLLTGTPARLRELSGTEGRAGIGADPRRNGVLETGILACEETAETAKTTEKNLLKDPALGGPFRSSRSPGRPGRSSPTDNLLFCAQTLRFSAVFSYRCVSTIRIVSTIITTTVDPGDDVECRAS